MHGGPHETGPSIIVFALVLEFLFLAFCAILVGAGLSELRKGKNRAQSAALAALGFVLAAASLFMTRLFLEG